MSQAAPANQKELLSKIPGHYGLPLLGRTIEVVKDLESMLNQVYTDYGAVSKTSFGGHKCVFLLHPDMMKEVVLDKNRNFSSKWGYEVPFGEYFEEAIVVVDFDEHLYTRRIFQNSFKSHQLAAYATMMNQYFSKEVQSWPEQTDKLLFYPLAKPLLLDTALDMFIGLSEKPASFVSELNQAFTDIIDGMLAIVKLKIPGLLYHKAQKADKFIEDFLYSEIEPRRQNNEEDTFSIFCKEKDESGNYFSDKCIVANIKNLIFASHDTASSAVCNVLMHLADNPDYQQQVREECLKAADSQGFVPYEKFADMEVFDLCFDETLRLHPPISIMPRKTIRECELGGYTIPANTHVYVSAYQIHHDPQWYKDPNTFDPTRFLPGREEHKQHPYVYCPFGGGAHKCIGMHMGRAFVKTFISQILLNYEVGLSNGKLSDVALIPVPKPSDDLPITLKRIKK